MMVVSVRQVRSVHVWWPQNILGKVELWTSTSHNLHSRSSLLQALGTGVVSGAPLVLQAQQNAIPLLSIVILSRKYFVTYELFLHSSASPWKMKNQWPTKTGSSFAPSLLHIWDWSSWIIMSDHIRETYCCFSWREGLSCLVYTESVPFPFQADCCPSTAGTPTWFRKLQEPLLRLL